MRRATVSRTIGKKDVVGVEIGHDEVPVAVVAESAMDQDDCGVFVWIERLMR